MTLAELLAENTINEYEEHVYTDQQGRKWKVNDEGERVLLSNPNQDPYKFSSVQEIARFYFKVPFAKKDQAKFYAMKWDPNKKMWYKPQYNTSGRTFNYQLNNAIREFGPPVEMPK